MSTVVVVGAGIVGSSVAYHLAREGVPVTLIDREPSPGGGVTRDSFAWIGGAGGGWPGGAEDLRPLVVMDYERIAAELPGVAVRWTGSLTWTNASIRPRKGTRLGDGQYWIGRSEIAALEPNLQAAPERAVYTPTDGGVDPTRMTEELVHAARALGAQVFLSSAVTSFKIVDGRVEGVKSSVGFHPASTVVLAAGTDVRKLCDPLRVNLPITASPAHLIHVAAPSELVKTVVASPELEVREVRDGHLLVAAGPDRNLSGAATRRLAQNTLEHLQSMFSGAGPCRLLGHRVGRRPIPANGPIVGYLRPELSIYVAVMHSAVTLAPTVGRLVAQELVTGQHVAELQNCRPQSLST